MNVLEAMKAARENPNVVYATKGKVTLIGFIYCYGRLLSAHSYNKGWYWRFDDHINDDGNPFPMHLIEADFVEYPYDPNAKSGPKD